MINHQDLEKIGFSEKESQVYLAALDLGEATIQQLAEKSGVKRVTVYIIIESLMKHGLISSVEKGKKTFFAAENPVNIVRFFNARKKELEKDLDEKSEVLKKITPELESLFKIAGPKLKVRFLQGKEGLRTMMNDFLKTECSEIKGFVALGFKGDMSIYGNKVWFVSFLNEPSGVLIEDEGIARMTNIIFDLAWEAAEKYKKEK
ncbi:MAG: helix-turn-helix domain-containing protein [Candidatus Brennerbacteria bacterium]|nr:helix-turn-helix domain-containing protein [Candidatus Brennerbacteria bacterium]